MCDLVPHSSPIRSGEECECQCQAGWATYREDIRHCVTDIPSKLPHTFLSMFCLILVLFIAACTIETPPILYTVHTYM